MEREQTIHGAELVANLGWVQRLALSIARNPETADDLTQEVARAWLERRPDLAEPARGVRAWLAAVTKRVAVDRARSEAARRSRERTVSRAEAAPDVFEVVERGAWQRRAADAVMELPEPYRSTILYRYLDQLPSRAVAERMNVREATVRKRLERGLSMLRVRLGGRADERWKRHLAGILIMTTKTKLAALALVAGLVLLIAVRTRFGATEVEDASLPPPPASVQAAEASAAPIERDLEARDLAASAAESDERSAVKAPAPATTGSLVVHVTWADDKQPAADVLVSLYRAGFDRLFDEPFAQTDEHGVARFSDLKPGKVYAEIQRRGGDRPPEGVAIAAGAQSECSIEVELGMNCRGVVVDGEGAPIADAEVLVADWGGGQAMTLAHTGADGRFAMRSISTHCHIGARLPGKAASPMRQFTAGKGADVDIKIVLADAAARLSGVILDPEGKPVAGAFVQAGSTEQGNQTQPDGSMAMRPRPARARTDAQGRFELASLPKGSTPFCVRARGLAPWKRTLELASGRSESITVQLEPGVIVLGSVTDARGAKIAKARIRLGEWDELDHFEAQSDGEGNFRIEGAAPGELKLLVETDEKGKASKTLTALAGETVHWDPVLSTGLTLRGVVLDHEGKPVESAMVEAQLEKGTRDVSWFGIESTDKSGRFELRSCIEGEPIRISVRRKSTFPELFLQHVVPSADELVLRLPKEAWVYIQGKVLGPDSQALPSVHVAPFMPRTYSGSPAETADAKTGEFRCGPYPPGEYGLSLRADGYPSIKLPNRVLGPDEVWDVGTLQFESGGTLLVNLVSTSSLAVPEKLDLQILDSKGARELRVSLENGIGRSGVLAPANHFLQVAGDGIAASLQPFEVRAGVETTLDVRLQAGVCAEIVCSLPGSEPVVVELLIRDRSGADVMRAWDWASEGTARRSACLLPGEYTIEASTATLRGSASFALEPGSAAASVAVRLVPK